MSEQTQQPKVKAKGTKVTETIIGAASNKMVSATKNLKDAAETALKLVETIDDNALKIADQEEKLSGLQTEFTNKRNQQKLDLELAYRSDKESLTNQYLTENDLVAVDKDEYAKLQDSVTEWETKFEDKVRAEVGQAKGIANAQAESARQLAEAQYQAKEANNIAEIKQLKSQLEFANQQTQLWKQQLDEERKAGVQRAQASSIGSVNVTPTNGR